jgi:hypothetical protein
VAPEGLPAIYALGPGAVGRDSPLYRHLLTRATCHIVERTIGLESFGTDDSHSLGLWSVPNKRTRYIPPRAVKAGTRL